MLRHQELDGKLHEFMQASNLGKRIARRESHSICKVEITEAMLEIRGALEVWLCLSGVGRGTAYRRGGYLIRNTILRR